MCVCVYYAMYQVNINNNPYIHTNIYKYIYRCVMYARPGKHTFASLPSHTGRGGRTSRAQALLDGREFKSQPSYKIHICHFLARRLALIGQRLISTVSE